MSLPELDRDSPDGPTRSDLQAVEVLTLQVAAGRLSRRRVEQVAHVAFARACRGWDSSSDVSFLTAFLPQIERDVQDLVLGCTRTGSQVEVFSAGDGVRVVGMSAEELVRRLEQSVRGRTRVVLHRDASLAIAQRPTFPPHGLTAREEAIVRRITAGQSNKELAAELFIGVNTVKTYIRGAYRKMGVSTRPQAVLWAVQHGLGPDS